MIPACVIHKIREKFPSPDGVYVGFKDNGNADDSEMGFAWVAEC